VTIKEVSLLWISNLVHVRHYFLPLHMLVLSFPSRLEYLSVIRYQIVSRHSVEEINAPVSSYIFQRQDVVEVTHPKVKNETLRWKLQALW